MPFTTTCPHCGASQRLPNESRGRKVACPECGERHTARPARRKQSDRMGLYVLLGGLGLLVVAAGVLVFVLTGRRSPEEQAAAPPPVQAPAVAPASTGGNTVAPAPSPAPAERGTPAPQPAPAVKPLVVASDTLRQQFARDESSVERQYKDRVLEVTGIIGQVIQEAPLRGISLGTLQDPVPPVLCELAPDQGGVFAKLKPGQKITVRGTFLGRVQGGFIGLGNCRIVLR